MLHYSNCIKINHSTFILNFFFLPKLPKAFLQLHNLSRSKFSQILDGLILIRAQEAGPHLNNFEKSESEKKAKVFDILKHLLKAYKD